jgi:hypothetical protein
MSDAYFMGTPVPYFQKKKVIFLHSVQFIIEFIHFVYLPFVSLACHNKRKIMLLIREVYSYCM